ncbi:hypothetical protein DLM76_20590 [Leptospira yasudae]|nr:hypothetical protein DLM76_20590 [Leptospira yasudae]
MKLKKKLKSLLFSLTFPRLSSKVLINRSGWNLILRNHFSPWLSVTAFPVFSLTYEGREKNGHYVSWIFGIFGISFVFLFYSKSPSSGC